MPIPASGRTHARHARGTGPSGSVGDGAVGDGAVGDGAVDAEEPGAAITHGASVGALCNETPSKPISAGDTGDRGQGFNHAPASRSRCWTTTPSRPAAASARRRDA